LIQRNVLNPAPPRPPYRDHNLTEHTTPHLEWPRPPNLDQPSLIRPNRTATWPP